MTLMMSSGRRRAAAVAPAFVTSPAISGTYSIGSVLTCAPGTWTGTEPVTPTYQWQRNGTSIGGATASTYTLVGADMIGTVTCAVAITNSAGFDVDTSNGLSWADYVLSLSPEVWLDAKTLAPGLLSSWTELSGHARHPTAAGALRPTVSGGEVVFAGGQEMVTPAFAMGARSSGAVAFRAGGTSQAALQYAALNSHTSALVQNMGSGDRLRIRGNLSGPDASVAVGAYPVSAVCSWAFGPTGGTVYINGAPIAMSLGSLGSANAALTIGSLGGLVFPLVGAVKEVILIDAVLSGGDLAAISAAMQARWP